MSKACVSPALGHYLSKKGYWVYHSIKHILSFYHVPGPWPETVMRKHGIELFWTRTKLACFTKNWTRTSKYFWMKLEHLDILVCIWIFGHFGLYFASPQSCLDAPEPEVKGRGYPEYPIAPFTASIFSPSHQGVRTQSILKPK